MQLDMLKNCSVFLLYIYIYSTFLFPSWWINKAVFTILLFNTLVIFKAYFKKYIIVLNPFIIQVLFLYGYIISNFSNCNMIYSLQTVLAPLNLFLIYLILFFSIDLSCMIRRVGLVLSICVLSVYLISFINESFYNILVLVLRQYMGGAVGASSRDYLSGDGDMGNIVTFSLPGSYHLFLPLILYWNKYLECHNLKTFICFLLILSTVIISGARGQWVISLFLLYFTYYSLASKKNKILSTTYVSLIVIFLLYYLFEYTIFFDSQEGSNSIKINKVISFYKNLDWLQILIGNGLGSYYHVENFGIAYHTELTLLDQIRYLGLINVLIYVTALVVPISIPLLNRWRLRPIIVCLCFLIYSFTNPVLINSLGHLVVLWCWSKLFDYEKNDMLKI